MARIKKEKEKNNILLLILVGIMLFGTVAGGLLFQSPQQETSVQLTDPQDLTFEPVIEEPKTVTIRHNPVNAVTLTPFGYQTVSYDENTAFLDSNHPLANKTLEFDITVTNITRANFSGDFDELAVDEGDVVEVNYTGRLKDGDVFDTSLPEIAKNESIPKVSWFNARPFYQALEFTVGSGQMIKGFDGAVHEMKVLETKTVEILPEDGYGLHDPSKVQAFPLIESVSMTQEIKRRWDFTTLDDFRNMFGNVNTTQGGSFLVRGTDFNASVIYASGNVTIIELLPVQGDIVKLYEYPWNSTVVSVTPGSINIEHNIESGDVVQFPNYPWNSTIL
jgi:FKBP-type peptidyl-prolyl cis-trans isomerase 2